MAHSDTFRIAVLLLQHIGLEKGVSYTKSTKPMNNQLNRALYGMVVMVTWNETVQQWVGKGQAKMRTDTIMVWHWVFKLCFGVLTSTIRDWSHGQLWSFASLHP